MLPPAPQPQQSTLDAALGAYDAGLCPVRAKVDGTKAPEGSWARFQRERPDRDQVVAWFKDGWPGLGIVCGAISGNLETLEWDELTVYPAYVGLARDSGLGDLVERIEAGYLEQSPSGGIHWLYRCLEISGNTKLAQRPVPGKPHERKTLIETRGEGGFIVTAHSHGPVHPSGRPYLLLNGGFSTIATITPEERRCLFDLARVFDLCPKQTIPESPPPDRSVSGNGDRPGDRFNQAADWRDILAPHGWTLVFQRAGVGYWRRPGKDKGISATTGWAGSGYLYVFSTSTVLESERGYSKFAAYATLDHGGDFVAAARALAAAGYGPTGVEAKSGEATYRVRAEAPGAVQPFTIGQPAPIGSGHG